MNRQDRRQSSDIAIITTCKGRLAYLRQTLPLMVRTGFPVTVVDYDCPERAAEFVLMTYPSVRVVTVRDRPQFNPAEARNVGADGGDGQYFLFLDCDTLLGDDFAAYLRGRSLDNDQFYVGGERDLLGCCLVPRRRFESIGGYDIVIEGWGYEDEDLYHRLQARGVARRPFDRTMISAITHADALRVGVTDQRDKWASQRVNSIYSRAKIDIELMVGRPLTITERTRIRSKVQDAISQSLANGANSFTIALNPVVAQATAEDARSGAYRLERQVVFTLHIPQRIA